MGNGAFSLWQNLAPWTGLLLLGLAVGLTGYTVGRRRGLGAEPVQVPVQPVTLMKPPVEADEEARLAFLAEAGRLLAAGLDEPVQALKDLARLAVPNYADACLVDLSLLDPALQIRAVAVPDEENPGALRVQVDRTEPLVAAALLDPAVQAMETGWVEEGYVTVPVCGERGRVGAISFVAGRSDHRYGPPDLAMAEELAEQLMTALRRSQAYRQAQAELQAATGRAQRLQETLSAALSLHAAGTLQGLMHRLATESRHLTGASQAVATCWLEESGSHPLHTVSSDGEAESLSRVPAETTGLCRLVCHSGQPLRLSGTQLLDHPEFRAYLDTARDPLLPIAWMAAPITGRDGRNLGLVQVLTYDQREFSADEAQVLAQLCEAGAVALENMRVWRAAVSAEERLREQARTTRAVTESMGEGVCTVDAAGLCTFVNEAARQLLGWTEADLLGQPVHSRIFWGGGPDEGEENPITLALQGLIVRQEDELFVRKDGPPLPVAYSVAPLAVDGRRLGAVIVFSDMTGRKQLEEQLSEAAFRDPLTGLPNRVLFVNRLEQALARARRQQKPIGVLFVDLDGFKVVNDRFGHEVGDRLLAAVGERLVQSVRAGDTAARLSGDEFTVLVEEVADTADAMRVAERIRDAVHGLTLSDQEVSITASVGVAVSPAGEHRADALLRQADTAMYRAKSQGKDRCVLFDRTRL